MLGLLAAVVVLDQATKWWGWRHVPKAIINAGRTLSEAGGVGGWYAGPVTGALLDFLDSGLLCLAAFILVRRRRPVLVLVSGALMISGWSSNLLDRLGMHNVTAPGSIRGAIDFIHLGRYYYNAADVVIVGATVLFLVAVCAQAGRGGHRAVPTIDVAPPTPHRDGVPTRAWAGAAALGLAVAVALGVTVAIGATQDVGVASSRTPTDAASIGAAAAD